jgi:hypothetical protein
MKVWIALVIGLVAGAIAVGSALGLKSATDQGETTSFFAMPTETLLLDPATGVWSRVGELANAREAHESLLLPDGRVLIAGGTGSNRETVSGAELFDPVARRFQPAGAWRGLGGRHFPVVGLSGEVILFADGGTDSDHDSARWMPPSTWAPFTPPGDGLVGACRDKSQGRFLALNGEKSWTGDGRGAWDEAGALRFQATPLTLLPTTEGALLVSRRIEEPPKDPKETGYPSHLFWDRKERSWSENPALAEALRALDPRNVEIYSALVLSDGRIVLLAGPSGVLWDPARREAKELPKLPLDILMDVSAELLPDDRILVGGARADSEETFVLDVKEGKYSPGPRLPGPRGRYRLTSLGDGRVLLTGGEALQSRPTGAKAGAVFLGSLGLLALAGALVWVARAGGPGARWIGFAAGLLIPVALTAARYWILGVVASGIRG